jgi:hypothetical protein
MCSHHNFSNSLPISVNIDFNNYDVPANTDPISPIEFVNLSPEPVVKFLGVLFNPVLNFQAHTNFISSKISKSLSVIRKAKIYLHKKLLKHFTAP